MQKNGKEAAWLQNGKKIAGKAAKKQKPASPKKGRAVFCLIDGFIKLFYIGAVFPYGHQTENKDGKCAEGEADSVIKNFSESTDRKTEYCGGEKIQHTLKSI